MLNTLATEIAGIVQFSKDKLIIFMTKLYINKNNMQYHFYAAMNIYINVQGAQFIIN